MEKRKLPRLMLSREQFRLKDGKVFGLADLSPRGMGLRILQADDLFQFAVGTLIEGTLKLNREKLAVQGTVRHVGRELVGVEFGTLAQDVNRVLEQLLDPVAVGRELRPIPTRDLNLWYAGTSGSEFLLHREFDGRVSKIVVLALGTLVQWHEDEGVTTGTAEMSFEHSQVEGVTRFDTLLISPDGSADRAKVQIAKTLLMSSSLPTDLKSTCVRYLSQADS